MKILIVFVLLLAVFIAGGWLGSQPDASRQIRRFTQTKQEQAEELAWKKAQETYRSQCRQHFLAQTNCFQHNSAKFCDQQLLMECGAER